MDDIIYAYNLLYSLSFYLKDLWQKYTADLESDMEPAHGMLRYLPVRVLAHHPFSRLRCS